MIRIAQPIIGPEEEQAVLGALCSGQLVQGERVAAFEEAFAHYLGVRYAIAVSSGTAALVVALRAHGIGEGDEVIVPTFTFAASANAVLLAGARPVLVDIRADDFTVDPELADRAITSRTRAVVAVHLYGHPCDMSALADIAQLRRLILIEDAAQALGAEWQGRRVGTFGTGCFSFYATKHLTTGEGGMMGTDDDEIARRARLLRSQGEEVRYRTDALGDNYRMAEIAAALGLAQLPKLDAWNAGRSANARWLSAHVEGISKPIERPEARHAYQVYTARIPGGRRDGVQASLRARDIEAQVYYPLCVHQQPLYRELGIGGSFPVAERATREVLSLPVHPALSEADLDRIASAVKESTSAVGLKHG